MPSRPCRPSRPHRFVGKHGQCVHKRDHSRRIAIDLVSLNGWSVQRNNDCRARGIASPPRPPSSPSPPYRYVGDLEQCVRCHTSSRRIAFGVGGGSWHIRRPDSFERRAAGSFADSSGVRRERRRRLDGRNLDNVNRASGPRTASAFWQCVATSRRRGGREWSPCLDHSRSRGVREGGRFGHLDK